MPYRGRLLHKFVADIRRLDTASIQDDEGYDHIFKEVKKTANTGGSAVGTSARQELAALLVPCQVEPTTFKTTDLTADGDNPYTEIKLVFHYRDLERLGLVNGIKTAFRKGDRIAKIYAQDKVTVVWDFETVPIFITKTEPSGIGLGLKNTKRNLLMVTCRNREKGIAA